MPYESKPTPASGMPTASLLERATPKAQDEIQAPKSERSSILQAISEMRDEARVRDEKNDERFTMMEKTVKDLGTEVARHNSQIAELASAQIGVARAAAVAAELSGQALARVNTAQDEHRKMIESAMVIQKGAISAAVSEAVEPIAQQVDALTTGAEEGAKERAKTNEALGVMIEHLGLEDRTKLGRDVHPGDPRPVPALPKLSRELKVAALASTIVLVVEAMRLAKEMLGH